jgi:GAF domain-containing protein
MYGDIEQTFTLDYGSFRDLQRHRHGVMIMPLASSFELNDFYEQYLTGELKLEFWKFTQDRKETLASLQEYEGFSQENLQHYHLLGENVNFRMKFALPQAVYIAELRSQQTVHPTLRKLAQELGRDIERFFPEVNLFVNYDPDELCFKRGKQTIEEKK